MRIESIRISNFLGIRSLERTFSNPVVLFAGRNGSGKSSLQAAIRMALLGEPERVHLKKDYERLITEGAKNGEATVKVHAGGESTAVHVPLPDGKPTPFTKRPQFLEYCLSPERFTRLAEDERRQLLFAVSDVHADAGTVIETMIKRGCDDARSNEMLSYLKRGGFPEGHKEACDRARDAKSVWRGATGEVWGKDKGVTWQPSAGVVFTSADEDILKQVQRDLAQAQSDERDAGNRFARLQAEAEASRGRPHADREKAKRVKALEQEVDTAAQAKAACERRIADTKATIEAPSGLACPHCGGLVVQEGFELKAFDGSPASAKAKAQRELGQHEGSLRSATTTLRQKEAELAEARTHAALVEAGAPDAGPSPHEIEQAREKHEITQDRTRSLREEEQRLLEAQRLAAAHKATKAKADEQHREVLTWLQIADALAPDGIPSELLSGALKPFNDRLREAAIMTGWRQVSIDSEMRITAEGRDYALLSESEQWRANAMITYAIATKDARFMLLDRMDVLDIPARGEALAWLVALTDQKRLDGVLICATLKAPPAALPAGAEAYWLEQGQVLDLKAAA